MGLRLRLGDGVRIAWERTGGLAEIVNELLELPARPVGLFRRLVHLVDPDAYRLTFRGLRLHESPCEAMCAVVRAPVQARSVHPTGWCSDCAAVPPGPGTK